MLAKNYTLGKGFNVKICKKSGIILLGRLFDGGSVHGGVCGGGGRVFRLIGLFRRREPSVVLPRNAVHTVGGTRLIRRNNERIILQALGCQLGLIILIG